MGKPRSLNERCERMRHHDLKIKQKYFDRIMFGGKSFEVRLNDRDYQVGDTIQFDVYEDNSNKLSSSPTQMFGIKYIHSGLGMLDNYVVLSIDFIK